ncbi:polysaccharide lyase family 14 protein [Plicaturopsis crispa FD-325 SS-3]|nr:polysaccharide lyase family 14 protein [Plicaturopsis crispa FD-325 SS-3]
MYASISHSLLLLVVLASTLVNATPTHHRRISRRSCRPRVTSSRLSTSSISSATATRATSTLAVSASSSFSVSSSASTTSSSSASSSTTASAKPKSLLSLLFPVSQGNDKTSWSTSFAASNARNLSDETLNPTNVLSKLSHNYVSKAGKEAIQAHYPKGAYALTNEPIGGLSFYAPGPKDIDITTAKEATLGYSVYFPSDFDFNLAGKLPGLYGGDTAEGSISCSGGSRSAACFSARLMWRQNGTGELYTYLPPYTDSKFAANKKVCDVKPMSDCNPTYGASVGRGSYSFTPGSWTTVSQRVKLNDAGQANGEIELFVGGKSVVNVDGLILRDSAAGRMRGIQMQTFFGGHTSEYASPKDQDAYFSDFSVAILDTL